jgi:hypothetical protein
MVAVAGQWLARAQLLAAAGAQATRESRLRAPGLQPPTRSGELRAPYWLAVARAQGTLAVLRRRTQSVLPAGLRWLWHRLWTRGSGRVCSAVLARSGLGSWGASALRLCPVRRGGTGVHSVWAGCARRRCATGWPVWPLRLGRAIAHCDSHLLSSLRLRPASGCCSRRSPASVKSRSRTWVRVSASGCY